MRWPALVLIVVGCQRSTPAKQEPPPPPPVPIDAAVDAATNALDWTHADTIVVHDAWSGLGCMHQLEATMTRKGDRFVGKATLHVRADQQHDVDIPAATVAALEQVAGEALRHPQPKDPEPDHVSWTDDYPSGEIVFTTIPLAGDPEPDGGVIIQRLYYPNQRRQLHLQRGVAATVGAAGAAGPGDLVALDPPGGFGKSAPRPMWDAYTAFLEQAFGLRAWVDKACGR